MSEHTGDVAELVRLASRDPELVLQRTNLAAFAASLFARVGDELHLAGHVIGPDRVEGTSPWSHGSDEAVGVSLLLRIGGQLLSGSADLFASRRTYAGAALIRQLVEVEYLAWAFEVRDGEAQKWLRSTRAEREAFFRPAKLREAAKGRFRSVDYSYHCEMGGHPIPQASVLLGEESWNAGQLLLSDALGHIGCIWNHVAAWAHGQPHGAVVLSRTSEMSVKFNEWHSHDPLVRLPPPPTPGHVH